MTGPSRGRAQAAFGAAPARGIDLRSVADPDEEQVTTWMRRATSAPGVGRSGRR